MDIRFLQSLVAVVETGSIAAAARREKLTPAAVSQRILALERTLNCVLLLRGAHSALPSEACLALLPRARLLIREAGFLRDDADLGGYTGELRIGAISTALTGIMPQALNILAQQAASLTLKLAPGTSLHLYEELLAGNLDAALLVSPPFPLPKTLAMYAIKTEPLVFISSHAAASEDIRHRIQTEPFIQYDAASWGGMLCRRYLEQMALTPDIRCELDALETIAVLVRNGVGNSLVPAWAGMDTQGLSCIAVPQADAFQRQLVFLHHSIPRRAKALTLFNRILQNGVGE